MTAETFLTALRRQGDDFYERLVEAWRAAREAERAVAGLGRRRLAELAGEPGLGEALWQKARRAVELDDDWDDAQKALVDSKKLQHFLGQELSRIRSDSPAGQHLDRQQRKRRKLFLLGDDHLQIGPQVPLVLQGPAGLLPDFWRRVFAWGEGQSALRIGGLLGTALLPSAGRRAVLVAPQWDGMYTNSKHIYVLLGRLEQRLGGLDLLVVDNLSREPRRRDGDKLTPDPSLRALQFLRSLFKWAKGRGTAVAAGLADDSSLKVGLRSEFDSSTTLLSLEAAGTGLRLVDRGGEEFLLPKAPP